MVYVIRFAVIIIITTTPITSSFNAQGQVMIRRLVKLDGATKNEHIGILRNLDPDKHFYQKTRVF